MDAIPGGVAAPFGFRAGGIRCGIKKSKKDLALIYSEKPAEAAGMFTKNRFKAAPVILTSSYLKSGKKRAVIINSGNANAATGRRGLEDAKKVSSALAARLGIPAGQALVLSTGVIGRFLEVEKIVKSIGRLSESLSRGGSTSAAEAIMTTDTLAKEKAVKFAAGGAEVRLGGIAKGAGMIAPELATMLCVLATDAAVGKSALQRALRSSVEKTFNSINVDGECSTNDAVLILANGAAGNRRIREGTADFKRFRNALDHVCAGLARMLVADGEGATRLVEVRTDGARTVSDARKVCSSVSNSLLVKTAVSGENPNWGRIVSAAGASGACVEPARFSLSIGGCVFFSEGEPVDFIEEAAAAEMKKREIIIHISLGLGGKSWSMLFPDISVDYVKINMGYS